MDEFVKPTQEATNEDIHESFRRKHNFPWDRVPVGMSFIVNLNQIPNCQTLRTMASREGKKLNRQFRVIDHGTHFEVYYSKDREQQKQTKPVEYPIVESSVKKVEVVKPVDRPDQYLIDLQGKYWKFLCTACEMPNEDKGIAFAEFQYNENEVAMRCKCCGEFNVMNADKGTTEMQTKFFRG